MKEETAIKLFEQKKIRTHWSEPKKNGIFQLLM